MNRRVWCFVLVYSRDAVCRALSLVRIVPQGHWYVPPRITGLNAPLLWGGGHFLHWERTLALTSGGTCSRISCWGRIRKKGAAGGQAGTGTW